MCSKERNTDSVTPPEKSLIHVTGEKPKVENRTPPCMNTIMPENEMALRYTPEFHGLKRVLESPAVDFLCAPTILRSNGRQRPLFGVCPRLRDERRFQHTSQPRARIGHREGLGISGICRLCSGLTSSKRREAERAETAPRATCGRADMSASETKRDQSR